MYYDKNGDTIDMTQWAKLGWNESDEGEHYARIGLDTINDVRVSTVWLGLDHNFGAGPPFIFETMIFGYDTDDYDRPMMRYSTETEARAGHTRTVEDLKAGRKPWFL